MFTEPSQHHEALEGSTIDDLEKTVRRKLSVKARTLADITCTGEHDGELSSANTPEHEQQLGMHGGPAIARWPARRAGQRVGPTSLGRNAERRTDLP